MLDGKALRARWSRSTSPTSSCRRSRRSTPATLAELEGEGWQVAPSAKAVQLTMNRDGIRDFAAQGARACSPRNTASPRAARRRSRRASEIGLPCVVKPVMSSSGKGQSVAKDAAEVGKAWDYAVANMRGDRPRVIVEEFIEFDSEITLADRRDPGRHAVLRSGRPRQEAGDYRESWQPAAIPREALQSARHQARKVVEALGGHGIFGVEFFVRGDQAIFSEL